MIIYLDNAASTPTDRRVLKEIVRVAKLYGNPSSYNDCGREAREYVEKARLKIARFLGARGEEVVFTGSGTESNNLAIQGVARNFQFPKPHIITTQIEHPSVLRPIERLEKEGFKVSYLSVDKEGLVGLEELKRTLRPETVLVSVMYANNEIGTIQPVVKISKIIRDFHNGKFQVCEKAPLFHCDACQATEYLDMNVNHLGVDLLTFNGSKIYGPKGAGVLYARRGTKLSPMILGGEQEGGLRAGTENVPAIGGMAVALDGINTHSTSSGQKRESARLTVLRDYLIKEVKSRMPDAVINGALGDQRLPNNMHLSVPGLSSEVMLLELDKYGICVGSGSALTSPSV